MSNLVQRRLGALQRGGGIVIAKMVVAKGRGRTIKREAEQEMFVCLKTISALPIPSAQFPSRGQPTQERAQRKREAIKLYIVLKNVSVKSNGELSEKQEMQTPGI